MQLTRLAYDFAARFYRRWAKLTLYSSFLGLVSVLNTGRTLRNALATTRGFKCGNMKPKKLGIIGASMFSFGLLFCGVAFPPILRSQIKRQVSLSVGSEMRDLWSDFPLPLDFKVYLFNVTNPTEIAAGGKPILQEVGPFFYDEYKQKVDQVDREEDDSVEYSLKATWYFNPSRSNGLTGEEELIVPHILILSLVKLTLVENPAAIGIASKAIDSIFKKPSSVFVKAKAREILFDGLPVDCSVKDFAGSAVCNVLLQKADSLMPTEQAGHYLFSVFGSKNGTVLPERIRVLRGVKNYKDLGRVTEFDGKPALTIWPEDHCNAFNGTDSTIFPPLFTQDDDIVSFGPDICRSISAHFRHKSKVKGVDTLHYTADFGDMSTVPEEKCFCPTPDTCLTRNLYDMTKCLGAPLIGSLPHFLDSDEKYLKMVDGLHPNEAEHDISMDFEPMTATPLSAHKRLQFNMFVHPIPKFKLMKNFPECLFPLFWVEEGILLDDEFVKQLKTVFKLIGVVGFMKWLMIIGGACAGIGSVALHFKNKDKTSLDITKVTPESREGKEDDQKKWPPAMNISTIQSAAVPPNLDRN